MDADVRSLTSKLISVIDEKEKTISTMEAEKHTGSIWFRRIWLIDLINLEQTYHDLENNYFEIQKSLNSEIEERDRLRVEVEEERKKNGSLRVGCVCLEWVLGWAAPTAERALWSG